MSEEIPFEHSVRGLASKKQTSTPTKRTGVSEDAVPIYNGFNNLLAYLLFSIFK